MKSSVRHTYLLILLLSTLTAAAIAQPARTPDPRQGELMPRLVSPATFYVERFREGNTNEGHLYLEAILKNVATQTVSIGLSFTLYMKDGTRFGGCEANSETVAPGRTIRMRCSPSITRYNIDADKVTVRPTSFGLVESRPSKLARIVEAGLQYPKDDEYAASRPEGFARVESLFNSDLIVNLIFRFYDSEGHQVDECIKRSIGIEPEVARRVVCEWFGLSPSAKPVKVEAEVYDGKR